MAKSKSENKGRSKSKEWRTGGKQRKGAAGTRRMSTTSGDGKSEGNPFFAFRVPADVIVPFVAACGSRSQAAEYLRGVMRQRIARRGVVNV
jgi:hypothetical protein